MLWMCCCAKARKDGEDGTMSGFETKLKSSNRILLQFVGQEVKLGLKEVGCLELIEKVLLAANKNDIPKKDLLSVFKSIESVDQHAIKNFLICDFFFTDNTRTKYDLTKVLLFCLLYSGGTESEKANFLFNLIENTTSSCITNHSAKLLLAIEYMATIPCVLVGEILNSSRHFTSDGDEEEFEELFSLYITNNNMLKEFAIHISNMYLFPLTEEKQYLNRQDFLRKMQDQ